METIGENINKNESVLDPTLENEAIFDPKIVERTSFLCELNLLVDIADRRVTNLMYASLKHTQHCDFIFNIDGWYDCYKKDSESGRTFGKHSICLLPPVPCGFKQNGKKCKRTDTHRHLTSQWDHQFIASEDRQW
jgi:hypothetical protein